MKILHTADIHLGDLNGPVKDGKNARREDTLACMRAIVDKATLEQPNVSIIAGDLFNRSRVWADTALEDITDAIDVLLRPLCRASDHVVLLFGTENHDNPLAFEVITQTTQDEKNLHIYTKPDVHSLVTRDGAVQILALPGYDKGRLRAFAPDADKEEENQNATALINQLLLGMATKLDKNTPSVLVGHYTIAGSEADNGSTFLAGQDVVILPQTIDATDVTLGCFGHIHKPQKLNYNTPTYYCGAPNQLTFNDERDTHGFYIHHIGEISQAVNSDFITTPERKHFTLHLDGSQIADFTASGNIPFLEIGDAPIVRVKYTATAEQDKALNKAALQKYLIESGAFHVAEILREDATDETLTEGVSTDDTPTAALHRYLEGMQARGLDLTDSDITRLEELAAPIIRKADDGREADQHAGAFVPKRIEVKNYRSYTAAAFDFDEIRMAMVNGQNGVGKSSLFMDAIADCLYEVSRDGQIGGWLREGEKSGAITFEFEMGGTEYRATRTRTKSGKGTLALNRKDENGEWVDDGDTTMKLTQAKIERTLGMDYQTFCSIALIRQDAYGIFLDTDSDRRMEVLASLLNLGVYARAEELAKAEVSEQRRKIASLKDRMTVLDDQMAAKADIEVELHEREETAKEITAQMTALDSQITAAQREEAMRNEIIRQADAKAQEAQKLDAQAAQKEGELQTLKRERDNTQQLADRADEIAQAVKEVEEARTALEQYANADLELRNARERKATLEREEAATKAEITQLQGEQQAHRAILDRRDEIAAATSGLERISNARAGLAARQQEYAAASQAVSDLNVKKAGLVSDSKVLIGDLTAQVTAAEQKAALLKNSECPIVETATCAFLRDAQTAKAALDKLTADLTATRNTARATYDRIEGELATAAATLAALTDPTAESNALAADERQASPVAALAPKLEAATATIEQLSKQETAQSEKQAKLQQEIADVKQKLPNLEANASKAEAYRKQIASKSEANGLQAACAAAVATLAALTWNIEQTQKDATTARETAAEARLEADAIRERIPKEQADIARITAAREQLAQRSNANTQDIGGLKNKLEAIAGAREQWELYRDEKQTAAQALTDYQNLAATFGIDGIQYVIIRSIVPEITARANAILAAMTGGKMAVDFRTEREQKSSAKIVNSLDVWIVSLNGGCRPYSSHSGGEKVKIALAVTLGLADVKARRAGVQLGMLFIDEPPFLDADGTEAYADALTDMASRNPAMRILAISHDPTMKARFSQNIIVTAGENGSEVTSD